MCSSNTLSFENEHTQEIVKITQSLKTTTTKWNGTDMADFTYSASYCKVFLDIKVISKQTKQ